ncbi:fungal-specific transcription factor domain-containing protein [Cladorrhinum samala]|uniref:Fungal-specific transcription factor domain-containing protein n=1 Tax=Cladorrhinum samala TaxID=585594 RepID=A0AAV9HVY6_9PEZI|nr:fungal-specific transcription factor domain-containing protein [Cladorrhinum samala]
MEISENAGAGPEISSTTTSKKRSRIRFSCTTCRDKKLKCDRQSPCDQCVKRSIEATCQFIPYVTGSPRAGQIATVGPRLKDASANTRSKQLPNESAIQSRLKHLEHLVQVLKAQRRGNGASKASDVPVTEPLPEEESEDEVLPTLGQRVRETAENIFGEMRYVDSSHWEAILSDLLSITGSVRPPDEPDPVEDQDSPPAPFLTQPRGPDLLLGGFSCVPVSELAQHLPPRPLADRLLARLFQAKEPGAVMFHMPTFLKQYESFWDNPAAMTYTQLGLLFAMFCSASLYYMRAGEEVPGALGNPHEIYKIFKAKCAQCLVLDDYTQPGPYKLEALILYFGCEYLGHPDATTSASVILSIIVRLAMHMGLHRDPRHYPNMSPFEGEMRRRVWVALRDVDILIAFQFGLPGNIPKDLYDTELPRNLRDEDFDQDSKELPPSRPETERTVMLWCIVKGRLVNVFSAISSAMSARKPATFADIVHLDRQLEEVHNNFPPCLRYRSFSQSVADPVDIIMQRFQLELLYLKSRIVLYRRCMGFASKDKRYEQSRKICLDAATRTLRHQYDIHVELQRGGRLSHDRSHWFLSSLSTHNFLLADMILCIELWCIKAKERSSESSVTSAPEIMSQEQILEILRISRLIWQGRRKESAEANRAFNILSKMLSMSTGETFHDSPESSGSGSVAESLERMYPTLPLTTFTAEALPNPAAMAGSISSAANLVKGPGATFFSGEQPWTSPVGEVAANGEVMAGWNAQWEGSGMGMQPGGDDLDGFLDPNLSGDWTLWDNQILNSSSGDGTGQIQWDTFFQPHEMF